MSLFLQEMSECTPTKVSTISLSKYELNKVDNNGHANTNRRKLMRPQLYLKTIGNLGKLAVGGGLIQGISHQFIVQCQMVIPESIHTTSIIWTK